MCANNTPRGKCGNPGTNAVPGSSMSWKVMARGKADARTRGGSALSEGRIQSKRPLEVFSIPVADVDARQGEKIRGCNDRTALGRASEGEPGKPYLFADVGVEIPVRIGKCGHVRSEQRLARLLTRPDLMPTRNRPQQ